MDNKQNMAMEENIRELTDEELEKVTGGNDGPEEFEWQAPTRKQKDNGWEFSAEGNVEGQFFKKKKSGIERDWRKNSGEW